MVGEIIVVIGALGVCIGIIALVCINNDRVENFSFAIIVSSLIVVFCGLLIAIGEAIGEKRNTAAPAQDSSEVETETYRGTVVDDEGDPHRVTIKGNQVIIE